MSDVLIREHLNSSLPPGYFWIPQNDFSSLLGAIAEVLAPYFDDAVATKTIRLADKTYLLDDLADEYGVNIFSEISDANLRLLLKSTQTGVPEPGLGDFQAALTAAGFDVQVHRNGPTATSPFTYIGDAIPFACDGHETSVDGNENAIDGAYPGGSILANGYIFATLPIYEFVDGNENAVDGNASAVDGYFNDFEDVEFEAVLPLDQSRWNNVYFIGGDATRDETTGEIVAITPAEVPATRRSEFESIILKYGPGDGWAGMIIDYI